MGKNYPPWMKPFPGFLPPIGYNQEWYNMNQEGFFKLMAGHINED